MADTRMFEAAYRERNRYDIEAKARRDAEVTRRNDASAAPGLTVGRPGPDGVPQLDRAGFATLAEGAKRSFLSRCREGRARLID